MSSVTAATFARPVTVSTPRLRAWFPHLVLLAGVILAIFGSYLGLAKAPPEQYQGEVQRILYIHVPSAWTGLLAITFAFVSALSFLFTGKWKWDSRLEASVEVGVLFSLLLCTQGAIWARPTWGVWWDWDPRLTTSAILLFGFAGILALRRFVVEPMQRATWSAVATVVAYIDVPLVYFSVQWWNSLHQRQSTARSMAQDFLVPLLINLFAFMLIGFALISLRTRLAAKRLENELPPPLENPQPATRNPQLAGGVA